MLSQRTALRAEAFSRPRLKHLKALHEPLSKLLEGGLYRGEYIGGTVGDIKGDTRSLDYSSHA